MIGAKYACLYSYGCQKSTSLGIDIQLLDYIQNYNRSSKRKNRIISLLKKLDSWPGYQRISGVLNKDNCFDKKVVRAYWLGSKHLGSINLSHNFATLARFRDINADEHLPDWIANLVLDCAVSFGKVSGVNNEDKKTRVSNLRLLYRKGKVILGEEIREVDTRFIENLKKEDLISIHLGIAREKISQEQAETSRDITLKALKTLKIA